MRFILFVAFTISGLAAFSQTRQEIMEKKVNDQVNAWKRTGDSVAACRKRFRDNLAKVKSDTELYYLLKYAQTCQAIDYSADFGMEIAKGYLKHERPKLALDELSKAVHSKEDWMIYCQQELHDEGPEDEERFANAQVEYAEALAMRADVLANMGYGRLALGDLKRAVDFDPGNKKYAARLKELSALK